MSETDNSTAVVTIQKLFGDAANVTEIMKENDPNVRVKNYCRRYKDALKKNYIQSQTDQQSNAPGSLFTAAMAFRKDSKELTNKTLYFLVFATPSLSHLQSLKFATQSLTQQGSELAFDDLVYHNDPVQHGRKTSNEEEAETIYQHFHGQEVQLGEVKRFVIEETPYPFHSRAIRVLEKQIPESLVEVKPLDADGNSMVRVNKEVPHKISKLPFGKDMEGKKFGNYWLLKFSD